LEGREKNGPAVFAERTKKTRSQQVRIHNTPQGRGGKVAAEIHEEEGSQQKKNRACVKLQEDGRFVG